MNILLKKEKGITLVALVITVVILLILAGITIATLTGSNGLFARAIEAREKTQKAQATDKINLKITNMQIASWAEKQEMPTLQYLADGFCQDEEMQYVETATKKTGSFLLPQIDASNLESIFVKLKEYPYEFEIDSDLKLASIDGVKVETEVADSNFAESEEYQQMISTINQLTQKNQQLEQKMQELEASISTIQSTYATKEYADALPQNSGNYTDLDWTLLGTTNSTAYTALSINIDDYNYIALAISNSIDMSIISPAIMSVKSFKELSTSIDPLCATCGNNNYVAMYYNGSKVYCMVSSTAVKANIYGIK